MAHTCIYDNELWLRTVVPKGLSSRRTSLITDPPRRMGILRSRHFITLTPEAMI